MGHVLKCGKKEFRIGKRTYIMGVLNVTPDSFSDGGRFMHPDTAFAHAKRMVQDGTDIIDVGGESTRPGSEPVSLEEERKRVLPIIERIGAELDVPISIDTYKVEVARDALDRGACMVNDISGLRGSSDLALLVAKADVPLVIMHMKGEPRNMQEDPSYVDVVSEIIDFLRARTDVAMKAGVSKEKIIVDPGIGFGKTVEHNLEILARLDEIKAIGFPVMIGTSRKSFIGNILGTDVNGRLEGTIASNVAAVVKGADFVRVHDVLELKRAMSLTDRIVRRDQ